ncbi:T9SS type A sorting domain-containing protein [Polaribacter sp.]|uniref:T9SS type A sorting domain-containing protein n=1 Tax=Polaribacter sp. TaxID=1920175 RepID=UPI003F6B325D
MKKLFCFTVLIFQSIFIIGQISSFKEKFELPEEVEETSGLLFFNNKIITHNDSGDAANLYEIDSLSGKLDRIITIANATNVDWEDITENETHIFIADIGNNNGNRTDLKIYKILKSDFLSSNAISAEIISYSYEDQTNFSNQLNSSNFDAEAIVYYEDNLLIFTKNWSDFKTNVYMVPNSAGNHVAKKVSSANVEGLITGAVYSQDRFFLTAYDTTLKPFLIYIDFNRKPGKDIFFSGFRKISLETELEQGSQVEAITNISDTGKFYISREKFSTNQGGIQFDFSQKLYDFFDDNYWLLSIEKNKVDEYRIHPNPVIDKINITSNQQIHKLEVYNASGKVVFYPKISPDKEIDISILTPGIYYLKIKSIKTKTIFKKFIKL